MNGLKLKKIIKLCAATLLILVGIQCLHAQKMALKTNLVSDALLSPNVGFEIGLTPKWTFNASGQLNLWTVNGHRWRHWLVQPEARYWLCNRFQGHFIGVHALGGVYNFGNIDTNLKFLGSDFSNLKNRRYEGWGAGLGIGYGHDWIIDRHWNIEAEIGIGWIYTRYDAYPCATCGKKLESNKPHNYFGPTKAAINIVYIF